MGYFDNPENKKAWDQELAKLTRERGRRSKTPATELVDDIVIDENEMEMTEMGEMTDVGDAVLSVPYAQLRIPMTYEQLLLEAGYKPEMFENTKPDPDQEKQIEIQVRGR
jgi:hypothetical protein